MKKSLIALAALAASGAGYAQVSITGSLAMGYQDNLTYSGTNFSNGYRSAESSGLGVDTADLTFTVIEDLGAGQKVTAKLGFNGMSRSTGPNAPGPCLQSVCGGDTTLSYTNNAFGKIELGSTREPDEMAGIPSAGAPVIDMDGKLTQLRSSSDYVSYTTKFGPVVFRYKLTEGGDSVTKGQAGGLGLGVGSQGASGVTVGQRMSDILLAYLEGPLQLVGDYRSYDNRNKNAIYTPESLTKDTLLHLEAGYDFGGAKVGFGYTNVKASVGATVTNTMLGVSVPVGAWLFGATMERADTSDVTTASDSVFPAVPGYGLTQAMVHGIMNQAEGSANGFSVGAQYNFSKNTNLSLKYASWTRSGYEMFEASAGPESLAAFGYKPNNTQTSLLLTRNF